MVQHVAAVPVAVCIVQVEPHVKDEVRQEQAVEQLRRE